MRRDGARVLCVSAGPATVGSRGVLAHLRVPVADDDLEDKFINEQYKNWKARRLSRFHSASLLRPRPRMRAADPVRV